MAIKLSLAWGYDLNAEQLKTKQDINHTFMESGKLLEVEFPKLLSNDPIHFTFIDEESAKEYLSAVASLNPKSTEMTTVADIPPPDLPTDLEP
jgi:hypothetical protein